MSNLYNTRRLVVYEADAYWEYPDGSNRCLTKADVDMINKAEATIATLRDVCIKAESDYRGMSHTFSTYGFRASAKEALETADYIKRILDGEDVAA